jgi:putative PIG3 family NAD(P)H quinone oxidoreductase
MRAAVITRPGGPEVLEVRDVPRPLPREGEVLVRVHASALNRADLLQREGKYPAPAGAPANIPGLEIAGEVVETGPDVSQWTVGDRVFGIVGGGGNAEFAISRANELARVPASMTWENAAAVPEAFITAHDALVTLGKLARGETVLVHAAGSGVGLAVAQLTRALGGRCFGTARIADKVTRAREYGLDDGIVIGADLSILGDAIRRWTGDRGVDLVIDLVGGPYLPASIECMAPRGRLVLVGLLAGRAANVNLGTILQRRLTIRGTVMRSRSAQEKAAATAAFVRDVLPLLDSGVVRPVVDRTFALEQIGEAHQLLASNQTFGKVVIRSSPGLDEPPETFPSGI